MAQIPCSDLGTVQVSRSTETHFVSEESSMGPIRPIHRRDADRFLANFEILGNVGLGVWHWGLQNNDQLHSVISFGVPCFGGKRGWISALAFKHGLRVFQLCRGGTSP